MKDLGRHFLLRLGTLCMVSFFWVSWAATGNHSGDKKVRMAVAFYNVENLFDTFDEPKKIDEAFLPEAKREWTEERYHKKLNSLAEVIEAIDSQANIALFGVCEIENRKVLEDLVTQTSLISQNFEIVHEESPDVRGIDVGLMYDREQFEYLKHASITVTFPFDTNIKTRDILMVEGKLHGESTHVFITHWPSRRGGQLESEHKRVHVAKMLRKEIDKVLSMNPETNIIVMGDVNDEPYNKSVAQVLVGEDKKKNPTLTNLMLPLTADTTLGTFKYKGKWNFLDQFIVSSSMTNPKSDLSVLENSAAPFKKDWLLFKDSKYGGMRMNQTYGGSRYYGGYSDHLPIMMVLEVDLQKK